jgi:Flp pilus assembly protein TadD
MKGIFAVFVALADVRPGNCIEVNAEPRVIFSQFEVSSLENETFLAGPSESQQDDLNLIGNHQKNNLLPFGFNTTMQQIISAIFSEVDSSSECELPPSSRQSSHKSPVSSTGMESLEVELAASLRGQSGSTCEAVRLVLSYLKRGDFTGAMSVIDGGTKIVSASLAQSAAAFLLRGYTALDAVDGGSGGQGLEAAARFFSAAQDTARDDAPDGDGGVLPAAACRSSALASLGASLGAGTVAAVQGDWARAEGELKAALARVAEVELETALPRSAAGGAAAVSGHGLLGLAMQRQSRWTDAEAAFRASLLAAAPLPVDGALRSQLLLGLGTSLEKQGRWADAAAEFRASASADPTSAAASVHLGGALHHLERWDEAEEQCRRALALEPRNAALHNNLGYVLERQRRFAGAEASYRAAAALEPANLMGHMVLGNTLTLQHKWADAALACEAAIALDPANSALRSNLGFVLERQNDWAGAERAYLDALRLERNNHVARGNLGFVLFQQGKVFEAARFVLRSLFE